MVMISRRLLLSGSSERPTILGGFTPDPERLPGLARGGGPGAATWPSGTTSGYTAVGPIATVDEADDGVATEADVEP
jgi:hypothetical protein